MFLFYTSVLILFSLLISHTNPATAPHLFSLLHQNILSKKLVYGSYHHIVTSHLFSHPLHFDFLPYYKDTLIRSSMVPWCKPTGCCFSFYSKFSYDFLYSLLCPPSWFTYIFQNSVLVFFSSLSIFFFSIISFVSNG